MGEVLTGIKRRQLIDLLERGTRIDGRNIDAYRNISIKTRVVENAFGSAEVSLGKTRVLAGTKMEVGEPFPELPEEGALIVNAQLLPVASPIFKLGRPSEDEIVLARIIDRALRSSGSVDLGQLCIEKGKRAFMLFVDVAALNQDGNLIDASMIATLAALMSTKMSEFELKDGEIVYKSTVRPLPLKGHPLIVTIQKIGHHFIVDPCLDEELAGDAQISIGIEENGNLCAAQKSGGTLDQDEVLRCVEIAMTKYDELIKLIRSKCVEREA